MMTQYNLKPGLCTFGARGAAAAVKELIVNTDVNKDVLMVLKGELATMLLQIAPEVYQQFITADRKGTPVLYVKLQKALYGLMRASLLFYRKI